LKFVIDWEFGLLCEVPPRSAEAFGFCLRDGEGVKLAILLFDKGFVVVLVEGEVIDFLSVLAVNIAFDTRKFAEREVLHNGDA